MVTEEHLQQAAAWGRGGEGLQRDLFQASLAPKSKSYKGVVPLLMLIAAGSKSAFDLPDLWLQPVVTSNYLPSKSEQKWFIVSGSLFIAELVRNREHEMMRTDRVKLASIAENEQHLVPKATYQLS